MCETRDYKQIEGRTKDTGTSRGELDKFLERTELLIEAVCDTFGENKGRTSVSVTVEHPELDNTPGEADADVLGRPPMALFKQGATLDDWTEAAGEAVEGNITGDFKLAAEKERIRRLNTLAPHQKDLFLELHAIHTATRSEDLSDEDRQAKQQEFETKKSECLDAGIPGDYLSFDTPR